MCLHEAENKRISTITQTCVHALLLSVGHAAHGITRVLEGNIKLYQDFR